MNRIAVDRYTGPVWYDSFADVVADFTSGEHVRKNVFTGEFYNELYVFIGDVVLYNTCYRDYLRAHGINALIEHLCEQAPAFRSETEAINALRKKAEEWGPLGDYDIQCQGMYQGFCVHGVYFHGIGMSGAAWNCTSVTNARCSLQRITSNAKASISFATMNPTRSSTSRMPGMTANT